MAHEMKHECTTVAQVHQNTVRGVGEIDDSENEDAYCRV